jgi:hypothetical protein
LYEPQDVLPFRWVDDFAFQIFLPGKPLPHDSSARLPARQILHGVSQNRKGFDMGRRDRVYAQAADEACI